jgi:pimeloyl-ACP methyl ester carboxylesterase
MNEHSLIEPRALFHRAESLVHDLRGRVESRLATVLPQRPVLPPALDAERKEMRTHHGQLVSYYQDKSVHGRPLVLLHSVNACASAYEMKPLFEYFRGKRPVFALDLPGFGFSERDARDYKPELYVDEIAEVLARVKDKHDSPDVVALSLSCEFAARIAVTRKDLIHTLAFISPTGFEKTGDGHGRAPLRRVTSRASAHSEHWWSPLLFGAIASHPSIHYFLGKSFVGAVPPLLEEYAYQASHQRGAQHAPLAFLAGKLFTPGIYDTYAEVHRPVLALYDRDGFTHLDRLQELVDASPMWESRRIAPTLGMPHFERLADTVAELENFWQQHAHHAHGSHAHHA